MLLQFEPPEGKKDNKLITASESNDVKVVSDLLHGPRSNDVEADDQTPLQAAKGREVMQLAALGGHRVWL